MKHDPFYWSPEWRKTRAKQLQRAPWCCICAQLGIKTRASEVDHITARRMGGAFFHVNNLQSLCKLHHGQKTAFSPESGTASTHREFIVCGPDGYPVPAGPTPIPDDTEE